MRIELKIPTMGESIVEATISNILKSTGSFVQEDEEIVELETDKVNQVLPAPKSGKLELTVKVGEVVSIGQVIGFIDSDIKEEKKSPPPAQKEEPPVASSQPSARFMTPQFLEEIKTGEQKKIEPPPLEKEGSFTRHKMSRLRKTIADRLLIAKNQTAMLTTFNEVDMSKIIEIRESEKEKFLKRNGVKLGFLSFFIKAAVAALKSFPQVNAAIEGEDILLYHTYDIGVAISTEKGLMVPVIGHADQLTFAQIESAIENFAKKARSGTITIADLRGGSFTITNGGTFGSLLSTPILNPPQSAILGMHKIQKRAIVIGDEIVIRPMMYLALSYDHRNIDGKEAVQFLVHMKDSLEDPTRLLLDI